MTAATCDTSVLIPALASWHPRHREAWTLLSTRIKAVPGHVLMETYSVLTRLPAPQRIAPETAGALLTRTHLKPLALPGSRYGELLSKTADLGIRGGSVYDGLVAATADHHGLILISLDHRARITYEALGVRYELL